MDDPEEHSERVASPETGRHSHRRRARKRRALEKPGAQSDGSFERRFARGLSVAVGSILLVGQLVVARIMIPDWFVRGILAVVGIALLTAGIVWLDRARSKKRNPKARWMRGILIAGFLCVSIVLGSLIVLNLSATADVELDSTPADAAPGAFAAHDPLNARTMQLKFLVAHILTTAIGLALLAYVFGGVRHRRDSVRTNAKPKTLTLD